MNRGCNESCSAYDGEYWISAMKLKWDSLEKKWVYLFLADPEIVPYCFRLERPLVQGKWSVGVVKEDKLSSEIYG